MDGTVLIGHFEGTGRIKQHRASQTLLTHVVSEAAPARTLEEQLSAFRWEGHDPGPGEGHNRLEGFKTQRFQGVPDEGMDWERWDS